MFAASRSLCAALLAAVAAAAAAASSAAPPAPLTEPFPLLHGDDPTGGPAAPTSPDPLVRTTWDSSGVNLTALQRYDTVVPVKWVADPPSAFSGLETLATDKPNVVVKGKGTLRLDWGLEHPAWFEFTSPDLGAQAAGCSAAISEYNEPWQVKAKVKAVTAYAGGRFRLETNTELYEGVRFSWIIFDPSGPDDGAEHEGAAAAAVAPWHITGVRLLSQVKPANYTGAFHSSDPELSGSWYSGAYGSKVNMMPYGFNSILIDRGDRVSIQGDGHPTMAAALSAFGSPDVYELVHTMLKKTDSGCANHSACNVVDSGLMTYPVYWASSVNDWYWASGDTERFLALAPDMARIIDNAVEKFLQPGLNVAFFGWDDRIANGFCGSCNREVQLGFAALTIRACGDFAATLGHAGDAGNASRYNATAHRLAGVLRARPSDSGGAWHEDYGVHAAAYAINAKVLATAAEVALLAKRELSDAVTVCSWSPFNNYWIVQALGNAGKMDYAAAFVKLCWAPMTKLGKGCFWELFSPEWASWMSDGDKAPTSPSYCHPWASGVTHWLSEAMAGVVPLRPGFESFVAMPHISGHTLSTVDEQTGCALDTTSVRLTALDTGTNVLGAAAAKTSLLAASDVAGLEHSRVHPVMRDAHVYIALPAGRHRVTAEFQSHCVASLAAAAPATPPPTTPTAPASASDASDGGTAGRGGTLPTIPPFAAPSYPGSWAIDASTGGDWIGKYGKAGYSLLAFDQGKDVMQLPTWVHGLYPGAKGNNEAGVKSKFVGQDSANRAYLEDPRQGQKGSSRALGWTSNTGNYFGADGSQGTVLNINTTAGRKYKVTLYMLSGVRPNASSTAVTTTNNNNDRCPSTGMVASPCTATKQAIRVMDLETLNPIAPEPLLKPGADGLFWTLTYDRGVRLRVMPIDGDSGFCAVFFDEA